jgi:hypothetical protein
MEVLVGTWTALRPPRFTGNERPFPDFGLTCAKCKSPLRGAPADVCMQCNNPFSPHSIRDDAEWTEFLPYMLDGMPRALVERAFLEEAVPFSNRVERSVATLLGAAVPASGLFVRTPFVFDALELIQRRKAEMADVTITRPHGWRCPMCDRRVPSHFAICWNCQAPRPDSPPVC